MASIGNQLTSTSFVVDTFSGTGSQTSFTGLTFAPASTAAIAVHVAGVYQAPSVYSLSGTTLTFSSAPALGTSNIQVLHLGTGATAGVPSDGSVTTAKMAAGVITTAYVTSTNNSILTNNTSITSNSTVGSGTGGLSVGPITISANVSVTVANNARYVVL